MFIKTQAIVLHTIKLGDDSFIVETLTEHAGRISFAVRIPKNSRTKMKRQFFMPLTILDIEFDYRKNNSLQHIGDVHISVPFVSIPFSHDKLAMSLFVAEFLLHATRGEQDNTALFSYVVNGVSWLDAATEHYANFHLVFVMRLTLFLGFFPNVEDFEDGSYFDLRNACFALSAPLHADFLYPAEAGRIRTLMRMTFDTMHLFRMSRVERNRILEIALRYYRIHIPQMPELNSLDVLKNLYI